MCATSICFENILFLACFAFGSLKSEVGDIYQQDTTVSVPRGF